MHWCNQFLENCKRKSIHCITHPCHLFLSVLTLDDLSQIQLQKDQKRVFLAWKKCQKPNLRKYSSRLSPLLSCLLFYHPGFLQHVVPLSVVTCRPSAKRSLVSGNTGSWINRHKWPQTFSAWQQQSQPPQAAYGGTHTHRGNKGLHRGTPPGLLHWIHCTWERKKRHLNINKTAENRHEFSWKVCSLGRRIYASLFFISGTVETLMLKNSNISSEFIDDLPLNCKVIAGTCFQLTFLLLEIRYRHLRSLTQTCTHTSV